MFGNNKKPELDSSVNNNKMVAMTQPGINIIGKNTEIEGEIVSEGDIRIDGVLVGNVMSKSKVVIGPSGTIKGNINAVNADISGKVTGKINTKEILFVKGSATIEGDFTMNKLVVESGAVLNGNCKMGKVLTSSYSKPVVNTPIEEAKVSEKISEKVS